MIGPIVGAMRDAIKARDAFEENPNPVTAMESVDADELLDEVLAAYINQRLRIERGEL